MTTLVFDSIRIGFPTCTLRVYGNSLLGNDRQTVEDAVERVGGTFSNIESTIHHEWIARVISGHSQPFFICDTDVNFYESFERFDFSGCALAGWRIPEWNDAFSGCITRARLHTSLLYIDPNRLRMQVVNYHARIAETPFTPKVNLFNPLTLPFKAKPYFYDTCALLYHAIGGQAFTDEQKQAYFHYNFGTIPDLVLPRLPKDEASKMLQARHCVLSNPSWGRGAWREQEDFYRLHPA